MADRSPPTHSSVFRHDDFRDSFSYFGEVENADHAATSAQLERILNSKSWKWTQWIRNLEAWIRGGRTIDQMRPRGKTTGLTVVVPIFNAFEHVVRCVDSVLLHTRVDGVRILLLDDASTDPRIGVYLQEIKHSHPHRVRMVRNKENLGFLKTANLGLSLSEGSDVILLNSDTIVGPHWAASLQATAAADLLAASVTAVSNDASIYSVLKDRFPETPDPRQIGLLAEQIYRAPGALHPVIPTGVGFCMLLTKQALKAIGSFDEAFNPGYGEENDWCQRAVKQGFRHYLDDSCFVYHVGHASMRAAGTLPKNATTIDSHERLLQSRHPEYVSRIRSYETSGIQQQVNSRIERACPPGFPARRMRIAFLLHQPLSYAARGGVERHVLDLVRELKDTCDCTVISPHAGSFVALRFYDHLSLRFELDYERRGEFKRFALLKFLRLLDPDIIHIQHLEGYGFELLTELKTLGKKVIYSIHDAFATHTVPHPVLTRADDASLRSAAAMKDMARHLGVVSHFVAPSKESLQDFLRFYPDFASRSAVIEHGLLIGMRVPPPMPARPTVCFLGAVSDVRKGRSVISAVVPELLKHGVAVTFLGSSARQFPSVDPHPLVRFAGTYDPAEVVARLRAEAPNVVALFSLFPETFSYTAHEALAAGLPLFTTPVGVFPRLMSEGVGRMSTSFEPAVIAKELLSYLASEDIKKHAERALQYPITPRRRMAESYYELYQSVLN